MCEFKAVFPRVLQSGQRIFSTEGLFPEEMFSDMFAVLEIVFVHLAKMPDWPLTNCENTSVLAHPVTNLLSLTHTDLKCF